MATVTGTNGWHGSSSAQLTGSRAHGVRLVSCGSSPQVVGRREKLQLRAATPAVAPRQECVTGDHGRLPDERRGESRLLDRVFRLTSWRTHASLGSCIVATPIQR